MPITITITSWQAWKLITEFGGRCIIWHNMAMFRHTRWNRMGKGSDKWRFYSDLNAFVPVQQWLNWINTCVLRACSEQSKSATNRRPHVAFRLHATAFMVLWRKCVVRTEENRSSSCSSSAGEARLASTWTPFALRRCFQTTSSFTGAVDVTSSTLLFPTCRIVAVAFFSRQLLADLSTTSTHGFNSLQWSMRLHGRVFQSTAGFHVAGRQKYL